MQTFYSFMKKALYDKKNGYYMQKKHPASKNGDYITCSSHPLFIKAIENFIKKNFKELNFHFLEIGAGDGRFIINLKKKFKKDKIKFIAVEKIKRFKNKEITFFNSFSQVKGIKGIIFSFEFFDSLPFHLIEKKGGKIFEIYVKNGRFKYGKVSKNEIIEYLQKNEIDLKEGQRIEVCLEAEKYYRKISKKLKEGYILTFDYGFESKILYSKKAFEKGTLMTYKNMEMDRNPLKDIFKKDITCAVNFTSLKKIGEEEGLKTIFFKTLSCFLIENLNDFIKNLRNKKNLIPPYDLFYGVSGEGIKALVQKKSILKN